MANRVYIYNNLPKLSLEHRKQIITHIFITSRDSISYTNSGGVILDLMKLDEEEHAAIKDLLDKKLYHLSFGKLNHELCKAQPN